MSNLVDKINSDFFEARNSLNKSKGVVVAVHVESEDDIPFWKSIFRKQGINTRIYPASKTNLNRGKLEVLKLSDKIGKFLILCVDSDYDYLLQSETETSRLINSNPFIFQTYTYSIENYKCYAENLHDVVVKSTLQDEPQLFDYVIFLQNFSSIIFELFLYSFHHAKIHSDQFTITEFSETIKLINQVDFKSQGKKALSDLNQTVQEKLATLNKLSSNELHEYHLRLSNLGVNHDNTYLFIKGHTLYENVVLQFLKPIEKHLKSVYYQQIEEQKKDYGEAENRRNQYVKQISDIELVLRNFENYDDCFLMNKILKDVKNFKVLISN